MERIRRPRGPRATARSARRPTARVAVVLMATAGIGLGACGGSGALPLSASEHLSAVIRGSPGSGPWCTGLKKTASSLTGLGRGESLGIATRIVRNDEHRVQSALHGLSGNSAAKAALRDAASAASQAVSELRDGRESGLEEADHASSQITSALTHLHADGC